MKLYSIVVLHKDTNATKVLKYATDLSSFSFYQKKSAGEFMVFTAKLIVERSALSSRSSVKEQNFIIHCFVRADKLAGVCVTDEEYQARVAFTLLNKVFQDFESRVPAERWPTITGEKDCAYDKLPEFLEKWQNPREADALTKVQDEVEETKIVLHNTMQSVLERGERLDDLVKASENLSDQSKMFYTQARKMNKCCNYV